MHPHAERAAEAAEAAGAQGKFWQMHACLFEHQHHLDDKHLVEYSVWVGLDLSQFSRDLTERRHLVRIGEDFLGGVRSGVNAPPTFFINGVRYDGAQDFNSLVAAMRIPS
jgi:protein-disulfide isomerase